MFKLFKPFYFVSLFIVFSLTATSAQATNYTMGVELFNDYQEEKEDLIVELSHGYRLPSAPTSLLHGKATEYSVLMIHGLNGSSYYMRDLAEVFHRQGMNVINILLPGHGTHHTQMYDVSYREWISETKRGLKIASLLGEKVLIAGFSTGAGLAINATLYQQENIAGLFLFAPAVQIRYKMVTRLAPLTCTDRLRRWRVPSSLKAFPIKYNVYAANGVCQVAQLIKTNLTQIQPSLMMAPLLQPLEERKPSLTATAQGVSVPTFMAFTQKDRLLSPQAMVHFFENISTNRKHAVAYLDPKSKKNLIFSQPDFFELYKQRALKHSNILFRNNTYKKPKSNPHFAELEKSLIDFIQNNF